MTKRRQKRLGNYQQDLSEARYSLRGTRPECRPAKTAIRRAERHAKSRYGKIGWRMDDAEVRRLIRIYEAKCGRY